MLLEDAIDHGGDGGDGGDGGGDGGDGGGSSISFCFFPLKRTPGPQDCCSCLQYTILTH
jgi:hypothetical protein